MYLKNDSISEDVGKRSPVESTGALNSSSNKIVRKNRTHTQVALADNEKMQLSSNCQEGLKIETPLLSKIRRSAVAPIHEVKSISRAYWPWSFR